MNYNEARFKANANDGTVPWRNDPQGRPFRGDRPMREIAAFGCDREVQGGTMCPHWCGQDKCGVVLAEPPTSGVQGTLPPSGTVVGSYHRLIAHGVTQEWEWHGDGWGVPGNPHSVSPGRMGVLGWRYVAAADGVPGVDHQTPEQMWDKFVLHYAQKHGFIDKDGKPTMTALIGGISGFRKHFIEANKE